MSHHRKAGAEQTLESPTALGTDLEETWNMFLSFGLELKCQLCGAPVLWPWHGNAAASSS